MFDALPAAIYTTDAKGRVTHFNPAAAELSGRTPQIGTDQWCVSWKLYRPDGTPLPHDKCPMAVALQRGRAVHGEEIIVERPDGTRLWCAPYPTPLRDSAGTIVGGINMLVDITEQKHAHQKLRDSEQRFTQFMRHLPGLAWIKDADGCYVYANDAAEKVFQARRADLRGKSDQDLFPPETALQFREHDRKVLNDGSSIQTVETLRHPDGVVHHSIVNKFAIPSPRGTDPMVGGIAVDITELKEAEEALRHANRRKDEFLAMLAHELRNPLAPILASLEVLRRANVTAASSAVDVLERQVGQMVRLVDDLLDASRISRGRIDLRRERVELSSIIHHAVEAVSSLAAANGQELAVRLPTEPVFVDADPARLAQIVGNLLNNACKFTDSGGRVWLTVEQETDPEGRDGVVIRVRDTGIGIAADQLSRVFEMFAQADTSLERSTTGLGIGLTLVKTLTEMHGGTVEASSAGLGHGSEFVVRLPIVLASPAPPRARGASRADGQRAAPRADRRRQSRRRGHAVDAPFVLGARNTHRPRRPVGRRGCDRARARPHPAGYRSAGNQRL